MQKLHMCLAIHVASPQVRSSMVDRASPYFQFKSSTLEHIPKRPSPGFLNRQLRCISKILTNFPYLSPLDASITRNWLALATFISHTRQSCTSLSLLKFANVDLNQTAEPFRFCPRRHLVLILVPRRQHLRQTRNHAVSVNLSGAFGALLLIASSSDCGFFEQGHGSKSADDLIPNLLVETLARTLLVSYAHSREFLTRLQGDRIFSPPPHQIVNLASSR